MPVHGKEGIIVLMKDISSDIRYGINHEHSLVSILDHQSFQICRYQLQISKLNIRYRNQ